MNTIQDLFQQAQLAEASYANFLDNSGNLLTNTNDVKAALIAEGFSKDPNDPTQSAQATAFVAQWTVVNQLPDTGSGFSATVFQNKVTQKYSLALRGTTFGLTDLTDLSADAANKGVNKGGQQRGQTKGSGLEISVFGLRNK